MKSFVLSLGQLAFEENWKRILLCFSFVSRIEVHNIAHFLTFFYEILNEIFCVIFGSVGFRGKLEKDTFVFSFVSRIEAHAENESKKGTTQ